MPYMLQTSLRTASALLLCVAFTIAANTTVGNGSSSKDTLATSTTTPVQSTNQSLAETTTAAAAPTTVQDVSSSSAQTTHSDWANEDDEEDSGDYGSGDITTALPTVEVYTTANPPSPTVSPTFLPFPDTRDLSNANFGACTCDVTPAACDINCCCDAACSTADRASFAFCTAQPSALQARRCVRQRNLYTSNSPVPSEETKDGLFCIIKDNHKQRLLHQPPVLAGNLAAVDELSSGVSSFGTSYASSWSLNVPPLRFAGYVQHKLVQGLLSNGTHLTTIPLLLPLPSNGGCASTALSYGNNHDATCTFMPSSPADFAAQCSQQTMSIPRLDSMLNGLPLESFEELVQATYVVDGTTAGGPVLLS